MTTRLWLVRHAPTHAKAAIGWTDIPADVSDTAAMARLAAMLPPDAVMVSSDLQRTCQTAAALRPGDHLPPRPGLREMHFGDWDGRDFAAITAADPQLAREYWSNPGDIRPPGGESWHEFHARISTEITTLCTAQPGRDIVLVVHFGVILSVLAHATGMPAKSALGFKIDNLSLTRIDFLPEADAFVVRGVNQRF